MLLLEYATVRAVGAVVMVVGMLALAAGGGCEREEEIRSYQAPKDAAPPRPHTASADPNVHVAASDNEPTWTVPAGWTDCIAT